MEPGLVYALAAAGIWGGYLFALKRYFVGIHGAVLTLFVNVSAIAWYLPVAAVTGDGGIPSFPALSPTAAGVLVATILLGGADFLLSVRALAVGAPQDPGDTEVLRECPECGDETTQDLELADDRSEIRTVCEACGTVTGHFD